MGVDVVLRDQAGVISRAQALALGLAPHDIRRLLRRREWVLVHPGVYVNHTGEATWLQRAWAAVLYAAPAALCHESALRISEGPGKSKHDVIHVAVGIDRHILQPPGVHVHRMTHLHERVVWTLAPPRVRYEEAVLDLAVAAHTDLDAIALLSNAVGSRRTTAQRMRARLDARGRTPRRAFLGGVLEDVATGTCSVLEHGFLNRVERAHGLPRGQRQVRSAGMTGIVYRDVRYGMQVLELDGRLSHTSIEHRDLDLDRDLEAAVEGLSTVRLGYGQVFDRPCLTAARLGALLQRRGWDGAPHACSPDCTLTGGSLPATGT